MSDLISRAETAEYLKSVLLEAARLSIGEEAELFAYLANKAVDEWLNAVPAVKSAPVVIADTELIDEELMEKIRKAPIVLKPNVDAAPVVHGRWIETTIPANTTGHGGVGQDKKKGWLCSNCKCAFDAKLLWCDSFCPNCGAKMDKEG